jgi:hypothetical protein
MFNGFTRAVAVTPSDSALITGLERMKAVYCGGAGNIAYVPLCGSAAVTLIGCLVGHTYYIAAKKIMATNTTATNLVALGD